jgi:hypothetical protein
MSLRTDARISRSSPSIITPEELRAAVEAILSGYHEDTRFHLRADADPPHRPAGCPFQALSLGELLRLEALL